MTIPSGTLKLEWAMLCAHVRRRRLPAHRGELPLRSAEALALDAPLGVAACALFSQRPRFATEQDGEIWRWVGSRARGVCRLWSSLRHDREDVRISVDTVRHWRQRGDAHQAELGRADLRRRWRRYRRTMRALARQLDWVRQALPPRAAITEGVAIPPRQAAE